MLTSVAVLLSTLATLFLVITDQIKEARRLRRASGFDDDQEIAVYRNQQVNEHYGTHRSTSFIGMDVETSAPPLLEVEGEEWTYEDDKENMSQFECPVCLEEMRPPVKMI